MTGRLTSSLIWRVLPFIAVKAHHDLFLSQDLYQEALFWVREHGLLELWGLGQLVTHLFVVSPLLQLNLASL